ncbi:uncharacterized protein LOC108593203 [Callithrix jacchus]
MMALSQRSQGTWSRLLLKVERQSCVGKMRNCELVRPKEANNEGAGKEASATRVISQPQMLDKAKEQNRFGMAFRKAGVITWKRKAYPFFPRCRNIPLTCSSNGPVMNY